MTHSPAPWTIVPWTYHTHDLCIEFGVDKEAVCDTVYEMDNAILICAAPEMLEALKGFVSAYKKEDKNKIDYWADYAQELIKKAEGN